MTPSSDERLFFAAGALDCLRGGHLDSVQVAYQTWGELNADKSNAILICHALSGDSNAVAWWDRLIGPGLAINTDKFFVIGTNSLGGCRGTTGPNPLGSKFPVITVEDMVEVQCRLLLSLGIRKLHGVAGGSMGGMQALEVTRQFPVAKAWITASTAKHTAMQIGFNEVARQAI
ncbi:MAG: alpha/beta fold hydrolase, partial [Armatimonadetes bacterium]|nr:alpha/beta fold hydrolase [Armatimonadota bacterium]